MATTFKFCEYEGSAVYASPGYVGSTLTSDITTCNWKNVAGTDTNYYRNYPITAGNNSYSRFIFGQFSGAYNMIQNGKFNHTAGDFADAGLTLRYYPYADFVTPSTTAIPTTIGAADLTTPGSIASGVTVLFSYTTPAQASASSLSSGSGTPSGFTQFLVTQLQTTTSARAGDTTTITLTLRYDEN